MSGKFIGPIHIFSFKYTDPVGRFKFKKNEGPLPRRYIVVQKFIQMMMKQLYM